MMNFKYGFSDLIIILAFAACGYGIYIYYTGIADTEDAPLKARYNNEQHSDLDQDTADVELLDSCEGILDTEILQGCKEAMRKRMNAEN